MTFNVLLDGIKDEDVYLSVANRPVIPTAKRRIERLTVPGRDGDLIKKMGYDDVPLPIEFNIMEEENIKPNIRYLKAWFMNKSILAFSDDPGYFRKIKNVDIGDIDNEVDFYGVFTVDFLLDPYEYQKTEKQTVTSNYFTLINPGTEVSKPLIHIYGSGDLTLKVNDAEITLHDLTDEIVLDCDLEEAYKGQTTNMNNNMSGGFPRFETGKNTIEIAGSFEKVEIDGRWRYV